MNLPVSRAHLFYEFLILSLLVLSLCSDPASATNSPQQTPLTNTQEVSAPAAVPVTRQLIVTVSDNKGRFVSELTREEFAVREGKSQRDITYFKSEDAPASIGMLVDVSASVERRALEAAKYTVARFIELSNQKNDYLVAEFSSSLRGLTEWTRDGRTIMDTLDKLATDNGTQPKPKPKGLTALNDASLAVLDKMASGGTHSKRVLLLIGDGGTDNDSKHRFDDLKRKIRESDILIYAIVITTSVGNMPDTIGQERMDELTRLSGGRAYFVERKIELDEVIERLALELRQQYVIGFEPMNAAQGGKWNKVKIKVTPRNKAIKGLFVRSREGYFSPPPPAP